MCMQGIKLFKPTARANDTELTAGRSKLRDLLKLPPKGKPLREAIDNGFPARFLRDVAGSLLVDVYTLGGFIDIKKATLNRRLRDGLLMPAESDRLCRLIEIYDAAVDLFDGDEVMANQWLKSPTPGLGGDVPIEVTRTTTGANDVTSLISKIEYGVLV